MKFCVTVQTESCWSHLLRDGTVPAGWAEAVASGHVGSEEGVSPDTAAPRWLGQ